MIDAEIRQLMYGYPVSQLTARVGMTIVLDNSAEIRATFGRDALARLQRRIEELLRLHVRCPESLAWHDNRLPMHLPTLTPADASRLASRVSRDLPRDVRLGGFLIDLRLRVFVLGVEIAA